MLRTCSFPGCTKEIDRRYKYCRVHAYESRLQKMRDRTKTAKRKEQIREAMRLFRLRKKFGENEVPKRIHSAKVKDNVTVSYDLDGRPRPLGQSYDQLLKSSGMRIPRDRFY